VTNSEANVRVAPIAQEAEVENIKPSLSEFGKSTVKEKRSIITNNFVVTNSEMGDIDITPIEEKPLVENIKPSLSEFGKSTVKEKRSIITDNFVAMNNEANVRVAPIAQEAEVEYVRMPLSFVIPDKPRTRERRVSHFMEHMTTF